MAQSAGAENNLQLIPYVQEREHVVELFQQADVFASPADHENGVANVYVEAMACGCPVIAGNTGGAPEAVVDGETGVLVAPRDIDATCAALDQILGDGDAATAHEHGSSHGASKTISRKTSTSSACSRRIRRPSIGLKRNCND